MPSSCANEVAGTPEPGCVPTSHNFTTFELIVTGVVGVSAATVGLFGQDIFGLPIPSMGPPLENSLDEKASRKLNTNFNQDEEMWGGVVTRLGNPIVPLAAGLVYASGAMDAWFLESDYMPDFRHEFLAYTAAVTWTILTTHVTKFLVGRARPYQVVHNLKPEDVGQNERETLLSFPGGHTSAIAATIGFVYLDMSDYLVHDLLKESNEWTKFFVGKALPFSLNYGLLGLMIYERVWSQEHWLSDNLVGAAIGLTFAHAFYFLHFDEQGKPRTDHAPDRAGGGVVNLRLAPTTLTHGDQQTSMGLGFGFEWN